MNFSVQLNSSSRCSPVLKELTQNRTTHDKNLWVSSCMFWSLLPSESLTNVLVVVFLMFCILSLIVNSCTLLGFGKSDDLSWEPRFTMLKSLIFSDLLFTFTQGPTVLHCLIARRTLVFGSWCLVQYFLGTTCISCALLTITIMALERYVYVCHAIQYLNILTVQRLQLALGLIWLLSVIVPSCNVALLLYLGHGTFGTATSGLLCEPDTVERHMGYPRLAMACRKLTGGVIVLLCILSYTFSYARMYQEAQNAAEPFQHVNAHAQRTVLFYCGMLIVQLGPYLIKIIYDTLWDLNGNKELPSHSQGVFHILLMVMLFVPPCINPVIYGIRNWEVRRVMPLLYWYRNLRQMILA